MWHILHRWAVSKGADRWMSSTAVKELIADNGRFVGVRAENTQTGEPQEFYARAVVMGTGSFSSNLGMIHQYRPDLKKHCVLEGGYIGARGDGHRIVQQAGGALTHMSELWTYSHAIPDHNTPERGFAVRICGFPWLWVNMQGRRFHDEGLHGGASGTLALLAQEPSECWAVIDGTVVDAVSVSAPELYQENTSNPDPVKILRLLEESPHIVKADTLADLASRMQIPVEPFLDSVRQYNHDIEQGLDRDSAFGRSLAGSRKMEKPPFYAFHFLPLARKTLGGVKTDLRCHALNRYYEPISGLYAAGELAGMAGGHINGKACLEGTMLGPSLFSGRVSGAWAASEAGFGEGFVRKAHRE